MDNSKITKIGIFYDGNYFIHISNYYNYVHQRKSRISIEGLHELIRQKTAEFDGDPSGVRHYQITDAHYFRGRLNAREASQSANKLYFDRIFDDILMSAGVTTHYLPVRNVNGHREEKGIDVWLALETFETTLHKQFDVIVLIASDGDYVPLVKKLYTLGPRVMLLYWDFEYTDDYGNKRVTRTSQDLLEAVTYPVAMHEMIENRVAKDNYIINNLFIPTPAKQNKPKPLNKERYGTGEILSLKNGYGFIKYPPNNLFFHFSNVNDIDFNELQPGEIVKFRITKNDRGEDIATDVEPYPPIDPNDIRPEDGEQGELDLESGQIDEYDEPEYNSTEDYNDDDDDFKFNRIDFNQ